MVHQSEWRLTKWYIPLKKAVADIYCISDSLKIPKYLLLLSLRSENLFARSTRDLVCLFVLSLCLFNIVKLENRSRVIVERNHLFNLWAVENDLSTDALVAGFINISLHTKITSLISFLSGVGSSV